jgi:dihydroorotase
MKTLIKNAIIVNQGQKFIGHILINGEFIEAITEGNDIPVVADLVIDAQHKIAIPGVIDDQVHFREPGLTHKGEIYSESRAAVAGGITSYMEMPNTQPQTVTNGLLHQKHDLAAEKSLANYSFYLGATNDNLEEIKRIDTTTTCGIKLFMGSSTGNMLVDKDKTLEGIFAEAPCLVATHCEDETTIKVNLEKYIEQYGELILPAQHPLIRSAEACYLSSLKAVKLAEKYGTRLHILHISSEKEMSLFKSGLVKDKKITSEVCVHHLWFDSDDYEDFGYRIKWNPAIKSPQDREALIRSLNDDIIDVVATDHAPHLPTEKFNTYLKSASGGPLVQHSLLVMLDLYHSGVFSLETIVKKMCHAPADLFKVEKRGYLLPGYKADIVLVDLEKPQLVTNPSLLYKCKWSPFEGHTFKSTITHTFVNGHLVYSQGQFNEQWRGEALKFNR